MKNDFDTSWFDLSLYDQFNTMSVDDWIWQLTIRDHFFDLVKRYKNGESSLENSLTWIVSQIKLGVIPVDPGYSEHMDILDSIDFCPNSYTTVSVNCLSSFDIWNLYQREDSHMLWEKCKEYSEKLFDVSYDDSLDDGVNSPHNLNCMDDLNFFETAYVKIELTATDQQIKEDFDSWLREFRKATAISSKKKFFTQSDFDYWVSFGVIPYLDLILIADIQGKKITNNKLSKLIFPNEYDVDIVDRIRKVTKPVALSIISERVVNTLSVQRRHEKVGMKKKQNHSGTDL